METAHRVAKNTGFLYARMAVTVFISLYTTRLVLAALGVVDFGIFNVVAGAIAMLTFLNSAMASATQRFMSFSQGAGDHEKVKTIFNVSVLLHLTIAIILLLLLEVVGYFLFKSVLVIPEGRIKVAKFIYQFMIVSTLFTIISVPYEAALNARENMLVFSIFGIVEAILRLAIAFYITYANFDKLFIFGLLTAAISFLLLVFKGIYCSRMYYECRIDIKTHFDKPVFNEMTKFAGWTFLGSSSSILANYGQGIVINMFFGTIVNAAQGIANQVSGQLGAFAMNMLKAINPVIDKSEGSGNRQKMLSVSMTGTKMSFFLSILFIIPVYIEMPYILNVWLKKVPDFTIVFCRLLLIRNVIEQLYITMGNTIAAVGKIRSYQISNSILNLFPLVITYVLFKFNFPPYALYIVFIGYAICGGIITLYFTKNVCDLSINLYLRKVIFPSLTTSMLIVIFSLIPYFLLGDGFTKLLLVGVTSTITFFIFVWFLGFTNEEQSMARQIMKIPIVKLKNRIRNPKLSQ
ncbi:MAG: MATE family efflux transporter [Paludibacter sp.]|nr:MATE family efflux transporter [Paludibacter sp.]